MNLTANCEQCFGLCCVALPFGASADFAMDKPGGQPCPNLRDDHRCGIHRELRDSGFRGCAAYECFGAGQKVSQVTFGGRDWRQYPETAKQMYEVYPVMQQLHEMLLYLREALTLPAAISIHRELHAMFEHIERLTLLDPDSILRIDVARERAQANERLLQASELARAEALKSANRSKREDVSLRHADLIGAKLRHADLRGADLRGALLIAADLRHADLRGADLIGADCRDADFGGADLTGCLFVTQAQLNAAKGDSSTKLSPGLVRPAHWRRAN